MVHLTVCSCHVTYTFHVTGKKASISSDALSVQISVKKGSLKHNFLVNKSSIYQEKKHENFED